MTLRKVNLMTSLLFKTQLKLTETPGVNSSSHSFTDNIVLSKEICANPKLFPQKYIHSPTKIDPTQFNFF